MHELNKIEDGFFTIVQDMETKRIRLTRAGILVKEIQPGRILALDELHDTLIRERAELERGEI